MTRCRHMVGVSLMAVLVARGAAAQTVTFEDRTVAATVDHLQWDGVSMNLPGLIMVAGAAAGDYNNDDWPDLFVTRIAAANLLFKNNQDGTFEEVGATAGVDLISTSSGCVWGDVNNDGHIDLYVLTWSSSDRQYLYINNGAGQFTEEAVARGVDLPAGGTLREMSGAAFGDYDQDGDLDIFVTEWTNVDARNLLLQNDGNGFFQDVTVAAGTAMPTVWGFSPRFADINNDGWPDLLIAADFGTSRLFKNLGTGQFTDITASAGVGTDENGMGSAVGDVDNDGDLDWFVTSIFDPDETCNTESCNWGFTGNRLYLNQLGDTFTDGTDAAGVRDGFWGWGTTFFDFDNDGDLDLGMTNGFAGAIQFTGRFENDPLRLWENDGAGVMTEVSASTSFVDTRSGKGFLVFDYDQDGDLDVFVANNAEHPVLFRNNGGNTNNWLSIKLRGNRSNRFGVGARIHVQIADGGPTQMREVSTGSNYQSQNDIAAHFGLGPGVSTVFEVSVDWPASGLQQVFSNVASNQSLEIEEPVYKADVNIDAQVTVDDVTPMVNTLLDPAGSTSLQRWAADVNEDGRVDGSDIERFTDCLLNSGCP